MGAKVISLLDNDARDDRDNTVCRLTLATLADTRLLLGKFHKQGYLCQSEKTTGTLLCLQAPRPLDLDWAFNIKHGHMIHC